MSMQSSIMPYNNNNYVTYSFSRTRRGRSSNSNFLVVCKLGNNNKQIRTNHKNYNNVQDNCNNGNNMIFAAIMQSGKNRNSHKYNNCSSNKSIDSYSKLNFVCRQLRSWQSVANAGKQQLLKPERRRPQICAVLTQLYAGAAMQASRRMQQLLNVAIELLTTTIQTSILILAASAAVAVRIHANFIHSHEHINEYRRSRPLCLVN